MDQKVRVAVILTTLLMLSGCAMSPLYGGSLCPVGPVVLDKADKLTRATAEQIVVLNNSGEKICGWKAPR